MVINIKDHLDDEGLSRPQKLKKVLLGLQDFYLNELKDAKEKLETLEKVLKVNPNIVRKNDGK